MKQFYHTNRIGRSIILLILLLVAQLVKAQSNKVNSPFWKCISTSRSGQSVAAIDTDGKLWVWGHNGTAGYLGLGLTVTAVNLPEKINEDTDWAYVTQGSTFILAIKDNGTLWGAGLQTNGVLGNNVTSGNQISIVQIGTDTDWAYVNAGPTFTLALKKDSTLWVWGRNVDGQLGLGYTTPHANPVAIPHQVGTDKWKALSAGFGPHSLGIKADGTLWAWGLNNQHSQLGLSNDITSKSAPVQVGTDSDWADVVASAAHHSLAVKTDGSIWSWGNNVSGQLGNGTTAESVAGQPAVTNVPTKIPSTLNEYTKAVAGEKNSVFLKANGELWGTGLNEYGELGNGTNNPTTTLVRVGGNNMYVGVWLGFRTTYALKSDGTLWAWGYNNRGQLGIGTEGTGSDSYVPVQVVFPTSTLPITLVLFDVQKEKRPCKIAMDNHSRKPQQPLCGRTLY